jgi:hypothetical protein
MPKWFFGSDGARGVGKSSTSAVVAIEVIDTAVITAVIRLDVSSAVRRIANINKQSMERPITAIASAITVNARQKRLLLA